MRPLNDNVVVQRVEAQSRTEGGLYIPTTAQEKTQEGVVVAVGSGRVSEVTGLLAPLDLKVGDRVLFEKFQGHEVKIEGQEYLFLREYNILCVL